MGFILRSDAWCTNMAKQELLTLLMRPNIKLRLIESTLPDDGRVMINVVSEPEE